MRPAERAGRFELGASASRARLANGAALAVPLALVGGLAIAGGGFDLAERHVAGLAVWLIVIGMLVLGAASAATVAKPLSWGAGLLVGLVLWSALSSFWSGSVERSFIEADRVLVYLGVLFAAFLIAQTAERRQRFAEGFAIALALIAILGLASRLLPDLLSPGDIGPRLRYPLGYWNANGVALGMCAAMLLWASRRAGWAALRWASVAVLPVALLALYFTYSRGGLLSLVIAVGCLLALSADRLWLLGTFAIASLCTAPAVLAVQGRTDLAENLGGSAMAEQGLEVFLILLAGVAVVLAGFIALRSLERRSHALTNQAVALSRNPRLLRVVGAIAAVVAIAAMATIGSRAWDQFSNPDVQYFPRTDPQQHFSALSGAGRHDFWRVAIDAFEENPLRGGGAGTYEFAWERDRSIDLEVRDAHSVYLEAFAELGVVGGLLVLALVGALLWAGIAAWRGARGAERERAAALLAVLLAFAVTAGFDWFWELAALGSVFFLAAGALLALRCRQIGGPPRTASFGEGRRYGLAVAGLAVAWVATAALVGPLLVDRELSQSRAAAAEGNIPEATERAKSARAIEPFAASPYVQLGLIAELRGDYRSAIHYLGEAIDREDRNWQLYYLRSRVERAAGNVEAARADFERARQLNPRAPELQEMESGANGR